jgi:hypothetical protein
MGQDLAAAMAKRTGKAPDEAVVDALLTVAPEYLGEAFDAIRADNGWVNTYFECICGLGGPQRTKLRSMLLA